MPAKNISVHLKFNTGMSRLGFDPLDSHKLAAHFKSSKKIKLAGLCSHLLIGEDWSTTGSRTKKQLQKFQDIEKIFNRFDLSNHILNSEAAIAQFAHADEQHNILGMRPGIAIYGIKPDVQFTSEIARKRWNELQLKPVMNIFSKISHLQKINAGESVSYNAKYVADSKKIIGLVPIGYADGYMRNFSNKSKMVCGKKFVPVLGTVCMDYTMVDLTELEMTEKQLLGQKITVLGRDGDLEVSASELAKIANTNPYEVLTQISSRVPREYHD
jgi:alanine racemase